MGVKRMGPDYYQWCPETGQVLESSSQNSRSGMAGWKKYTNLHYWRAQSTSSHTCLAEFWCNFQGQHTSTIPFAGRSWFISMGRIWQKSHFLHVGRTAKL